jgi:hypothetical protein
MAFFDKLCCDRKRLSLRLEFLSARKRIDTCLMQPIIPKEPSSQFITRHPLHRPSLGHFSCSAHYSPRVCTITADHKPIDSGEDTTAWRRATRHNGNNRVRAARASEARHSDLSCLSVDLSSTHSASHPLSLRSHSSSLSLSPTSTLHTHTQCCSREQHPPSCEQQQQQEHTHAAPAS